MEIHESALPLPLDLVGQLFLPPVLRLQQRRAGLRDDAFHFLNELVGVFVGERRAHNEDRLVELHAENLLLAKGPGTASGARDMSNETSSGPYHSAQRAVN